MSEIEKNQLSPQWQAVAQYVEEYEQAFRENGSELQSFVSQVDPQYREAALQELICVDLELQWKSGRRVFVEEYVESFPQVKSQTSSMLELYRAEYSTRISCGETPNIHEYKERFPDFVPPGDETGRENLAATVALEDATPDDLRIQEVPAVIGRYRVETCIGSGTYGDVYRCHDPELDRHVAIKIGRLKHTEAAIEAVQYNHEAKAVARLRHPGIVLVLDIGRLEDGRTYIVYELVKGQTMKDRIEEGNYTPAEAVGWVIQVAEALHYAHKQGLVHRDIKPGNILIDSDGCARVTDFGLAMLDDEFFTAAEGTIGTYAYMSPEQALGRSHWATATSDLYSVGTVLYELVCGRRPFSANSRTEMIKQVAERPVPPPRSIDERIPKQVEEICLKSLAKDPGDRYTSCHDLAQELRSAMAGKSSRKPLMIAAAVLAILLVAAGGVGAFMIRGPQTSLPAIADVGRPELELRVAGADGVFKEMEPGMSSLNVGDQIKLSAWLRQPAYVYLYWYAPEDGATRLWPEDLATQKPTADVELPVVTLSGDQGNDMAIALVSDHPLGEDELREVESRSLPSLAGSPHDKGVISEAVAIDSSSPDDETRGIIQKPDAESTTVVVPLDQVEGLQGNVLAYHAWFVPYKQAD